MPNQITIFTEAHSRACVRAKRLLTELLLRVQGDLGSPQGRHTRVVLSAYALATLPLSRHADARSAPGGSFAVCQAARDANELVLAREQSGREAVRRVCRENSGREERCYSLTQEVVEEEAGKWKLVEISLSDYPERREELLQLSNSFLVPQIFFNNYWVGGWPELEAHDQQGELETLLETCVDNYEYRRTPAVSRSLWEEREAEKEHRAKCEGVPGPASLSAPRPFFDTPLSLYQRSSIAGRVEEARRASTEGEGSVRRLSTPKHTSSSRFSLRSPRQHTLRRPSPFALPPAAREGSDAEEPRKETAATGLPEWKKTSSLPLEQSISDEAPRSAEPGTPAARRQAPASKMETEDEKGEKERETGGSAVEPGRDGDEDESEEEKGEAGVGEREGEKEGGGERGGEENEGRKDEPRDKRRISYLAEYVCGKVEKTPTRWATSSPYCWPATCNRSVSLQLLDPRVRPPTYSPRRSASSKEAEELKRRDRFYAGAFVVPASAADVDSGKYVICTDPQTGHNMKKITYAELLKTLRVILPFSDRTAYLRTHKQCFVASEAVDAFCSKLHFPTREAAVQFGRDLVRHSVIQLANQDQLVVFSDSPALLYRLQMHQEPLVLNWTVIWTKPVVTSLMGLSRYLYTLFHDLEEDHQEEKTSLVDQAGVKNDARYLDFQIAVCELQTVDLLNLKSESVKKAFLMNVYNLLCKHALIELGVPADSTSRKNFFSSVSYCIGGYRFTLNELENGLLRCNRRACYSLTKPFGFRDQRLQFVLSEFDSRIHFGLNYGTKSGPPVRFYEAESIEEELRIAAEAFCESNSNVHVDVPGKTLWLSKIFRWYENDFAVTNVKMALFLLPLLRGEKRENITSLLRAAKVDLSLPHSPRTGSVPPSRFAVDGDDRCMREADLPFSPSSLRSSASSAAPPASPSAVAHGVSYPAGARKEGFVHAPPLHVSSCPTAFHHPLPDAHAAQRERDTASSPPHTPGLPALHTQSEREGASPQTAPVPPPRVTTESGPPGSGVPARGRGVHTPGGGSTPGTFFQKLLTRSRTSLAIEGSPLAHAASLFSRSGSGSFLPGSSNAFKIKYLDYDWSPNITVSHRYRGSWFGDMVGRVQTVLPTQVINMSLHAYSTTGHGSQPESSPKPFLPPSEKDEKRGENPGASSPGAPRLPSAAVTSDASTALAPGPARAAADTGAAVPAAIGETEGEKTRDLEEEGKTQGGEKRQEERDGREKTTQDAQDTDWTPGVAAAGKKAERRRSNAEKLWGKKGEKREEEEGERREDRSVAGRTGFLKARTRKAQADRGKDTGDAWSQTTKQPEEAENPGEPSSDGAPLGGSTPAETPQKRRGRPRQLKEKFQMKVAERK
ncbi:hypothetical protein NCLIV_068190 [Neospora caninum Liverpool]|uniref:DEP domain-containing protein n=1 Tax=Neospora caninum (strain Liverpool) TaxID=572307 RepID=F0VRP7_NEOCL|nr:hypothetical protein NCLIV_068190 [Neospora caninum Liverpool]CBZ56395.1 hypothetical protein NCLIV_068190 [Neospora caninum Liverpool]CEL71155.1 TPA: hypothetical protein BN1204_068190 [Neospora caninum Liverpool]|eukprot:XP_003886420.1 hypothetical protein NCLIV_068190 [Neospora caninum Liverpool]